MHLKSLLHSSVLSATLLLSAPALVAASAEKSPAPAQQPDAYPLKTCVVSDEALGSMGDYVTYVHKEAGKPDRAIRLCCDGCIDDFKKEPAKFIAKLDAAAKAKAAPEAKAGGKAKAAHDHGK